MESYVIGVGLTIREGERTFRLTNEIADSQAPTYAFIDQLTGRPRVLKLDELHRGIQSRQFQLVAQGNDAGGTAKTIKRGVTVADLPRKYSSDLLRKIAYVRAASKARVELGSRLQLRKFLEGLGGKHPKTKEVDPSPPSASTLSRWGLIWLKNGMTDLALVCGNYARRRKESISKIVLEIVDTAIREVYCTPARNTQRQVFEEALFQIKAKNSEGGQLKLVSFSTVRRRLGKFDPQDVMAARMGHYYAKNKFRYGTALKYIAVMERYEIDHTILDIVVLCPFTGTPLGRPTLTLVVDKGSGYPVGAFISFWGTGLATTLSGLKVAISPKFELTAALELSSPWLGYGIPMMFVVDNGLEFHSPQFMLAAAAMSTEVHFAPVRTGWYKAVVERTLQTVMSGFPSQGKVHKRADNNYLPPNPDRTAAITFDHLCENVVRSLATVIPFEPPAFRIRRSVDLFQEAMDTMLPPRMPGSMDDLNLIAAMQCERVVSHNGVMVEWLPYRSLELAQVRRVVGENFRTVVKYDPQDLSSVYVRNPLNKQWVLVPCAFGEYARNLSIVQHRAIRQQLKGQLTALNAYELFVQRKRELTERWQQSAAFGKRLASAKLRALGGLTMNKVLMGMATEDEPPKIWTPTPPPAEILIPDRSSLKDSMEESLETFDFL